MISSQPTCELSTRDKLNSQKLLQTTNYTKKSIIIRWLSPKKKERRRFKQASCFSLYILLRLTRKRPRRRTNN